MKAEKINIAEKFEQVTEYWEPKIIEQMNDYQFKLAKFKGDFTWHDHKETDEVFFVIEGEMFVVSKGVEHKPYAKEECKAMLIEPAGTVNTGDVVDA